MLAHMLMLALQRWDVVKKSGTTLRLQLARPSAAQQEQQASGSAVDVELRYAPAQLEVSVGGQPVLVWNDNRQFIFEHLREQQVGGCKINDGLV